MGLLWTFGITYIVIGSLNLITAFLFVVLFGLSIEFGVHLFYRYLECRREGADVEAALRLVLERTGKAMLTSGATTATAFFSLLITEFRGFSEFGFIMGLGYLLCLVSMLTLFPALLIVSERWRMIRLNNREAVARIFRNGPIPFVWGIIGVGVLFTVFSLAVLPHLPFEYDFRRLRAYVPETEKAKEKAGKIFTLAQSPVVVLAESREDMDAIVAAVHAHMAADTLSPTIDTVRTIYDELPADQDEKLFTIKEIKTLLEENDVSSFLSGEQLEKMDEFRELLEVKSIGIEDLPYGIRRRFIGTDGAVGNFVFIYPSVSLADGQQAIRFAEDVRDIPLPDGRVYHASSGDIIFADVLLVMKRDSKIAIVAAFIVVFLIVLLDFRSLRSALLVLLPLVVGIIWMCGGMVVFGMKISLFNMVVFPSIIGLSLDSGVHLYHRYLEEGPGNLWKVFLTTGQAVAVGALTTMLGFADLVLARHPGLKSLGSLAVLGLVTTLITALVLFPAALQAAERLRSRRRSS
jgi:predicted RND superfamily exporter protein